MTLSFSTHTSSSTGTGGGGKLALSSLRMEAFAIPDAFFAFFPMMSFVIDVIMRSKKEFFKVMDGAKDSKENRYLDMLTVRTNFLSQAIALHLEVRPVETDELMTSFLARTKLLHSVYASIRLYIPLFQILTLSSFLGKKISFGSVCCAIASLSLESLNVIHKVVKISHYHSRQESDSQRYSLKHR